MVAVLEKNIIKLNISACIITDNNPAVIDCIKSVYDYCSEIILVNTTETGNLEFPNHWDKVKNFFFKWNNSFSDARNYSISKATGDWILIIDSDEILETPIRILDERYLVYSCVQSSIEKGRTVDVKTLRLFQNHKEIYFKNKVHETIEHCLVTGHSNKISEHLLLQGGVCNSNIILKHNGYNLSEVEIKAKMQRNYDIMLTDYDNEVRYVHLGNYWFSQKKYLKAMSLYRKGLKSKLDNRYRAILFNNIFACQVALKHPYKAQLRSLSNSIVSYPEQLQARINIVETLIYTVTEKNKNSYYRIIDNELQKIKRIDSEKLSGLELDARIDSNYINQKYKEIGKWQ